MQQALLVFDFDRDHAFSCWDQAKQLVGITDDDDLDGQYLGYDQQEDDSKGNEAEVIIRRELMRWPTTKPSPTVVVFIELPEAGREELRDKIRADHSAPVHVVEA